MRTALVFVALAATLPSAAEDLGRFGPLNAVHVPPLSVHAFGGSLEYERYLWPERHLSLAVRGGARAAAKGDFAGLGLGAGVEARAWYAQRFLMLKPAPEVMAGPYLALALDLSGSNLRERGADAVGSQFALHVSALAGYRMFAVWGLVGTVYGGLLVSRSWLFDGRTAAENKVRPTWGFTVGWAF